MELLLSSTILVILGIDSVGLSQIKELKGSLTDQGELDQSGDINVFYYTSNPQHGQCRFKPNRGTKKLLE